MKGQKTHFFVVALDALKSLYLAIFSGCHIRAAGLDALPNFLAEQTKNTAERRRRREGGLEKFSPAKKEPLGCIALFLTLDILPSLVSSYLFFAGPWADIARMFERV